ncbi:MAG: hypothetical protein KF708_17255 [Pirellulales bacterium]|nr:hypothetical protein [Pirellulales bacterium]
MPGLFVAVQIAWEPIALGLLAFAGALGLLAVVSPRLFQKLAGQTDRWVDSSRALECLDRRVDIDAYILPRSRLLGVAVLASVAVLSYLVVTL